MNFVENTLPLVFICALEVTIRTDVLQFPLREWPIQRVQYRKTT